MNLKYTLSKSDFLEYQLYASSKSKSQKGRRFRSRIIIPIIYVALGLYVGSIDENFAAGLVFAAVGVVWFILYPKYSKWRYKKHFQKHIEEHYASRIDKTVALTIQDNTLITKDFTAETKVNASELNELIELQHHFFIKLTTELALIVPKSAISDLEAFKKELLTLGADYVDDSSWQWK
ncbi:YcxB family protein [Aestuariibaculum suncheonense]|uniref:YcxB family protein n=1 Tax=Aestuariibaculum suncheonense TaxID=1028745 RepID=A0A8J6UHJ8_9FLAO|nr:YcxB family protein [Aestuariibaculum suncheonense]MBD0835844.1 YcxB family protein [Aestuariibaculum suncheonense]